jgi:hypothetical protein
MRAGRLRAERARLRRYGPPTLLLTSRGLSGIEVQLGKAADIEHRVVDHGG